MADALSLVVLICCRCGQSGERADLPRQLGRRRERDARLQHSGRVARHLPQGRDHRHRLLPAQRPQRGRRADVHAAADVPQDQEHQAVPREVLREPDQRGRRHRRRSKILTNQ